MMKQKDNDKLNSVMASVTEIMINNLYIVGKDAVCGNCRFIKYDKNDASHYCGKRIFNCDISKDNTPCVLHSFNEGKRMVN